MGHRPLPVSLSLIALATTLACSNSDTTEDRNVLETAVIVDPAEFLGAFPCGDIDGAPKSYVATVTDLGAPCEATDEDCVEPTPQELGASPRVGCATPVAFTDVVAGHFYSASIQVFEGAPDEPQGAAWPTIVCGADQLDGAAKALSLKQVTIRGCEKLAGPGLGQTAIVIDPLTTLGSLECASEGSGGSGGGAAEGGASADPGVVSFTVIPTDPVDVVLPTVTVACDEGPITYGTDALEPGVGYTFRIEAELTAGSQPWATTCTATALEGLGVHASCSTLASGGGITFPITQLLADADLTCGDDVTRARIALFDDPDLIAQSIVGCSADVTIPGAAAGIYTATVELLDGATSVAIFECVAAIEPGSSATLECEAQP